MENRPRNVEFIEDESDETETVRDEELLEKIIEGLRATAVWNTNPCKQDN